MKKLVLITGGTKGIGKAVALCLAKASYDLILTYASDYSAAESSKKEIEAGSDSNVRLLQADITDDKTIDLIDGKRIYYPGFNSV